jgi:hypothetical protein
MSASGTEPAYPARDGSVRQLSGPARVREHIIANRDAREDDRSAPDPDVAANAHRPSELQTSSPLLGIMGMVGSVDLHRWPDLRSFTNRHFHHVEDDAVEVEEGVGSHLDVEAIVTVKGRADDRSGSDLGQPLAQERMPMTWGLAESIIVPLQPDPRGQQVSLDLRISRIVQFTSEHLLFLAAGHVASFTPDLAQRSG